VFECLKGIQNEEDEDKPNQVGPCGAICVCRVDKHDEIDLALPFGEPHMKVKSYEMKNLIVVVGTHTSSICVNDIPVRRNFVFNDVKFLVSTHPNSRNRCAIALG